MIDRVKSFLLVIFSIIAILLIAYNLYTGATVQRIGIPGIFEINFGSSPKIPSTPRPRPDVKFLETNIETPDVHQPFGGRFKGTFVVFNEGNTTAEGCIVWLQDGGSKEFGLPPRGRRQVETATSSLYRGSGTYEIAIWIDCDNDTSPKISRRFAIP
jgi:hypothetical protein